MKGDVEFLQSFANFWYSRFAASAEVQTKDTRTLADAISWDLGDQRLIWTEFLRQAYAQVALPEGSPKLVDSVLYLKDEDVVLSAIDFHCSPLVTSFYLLRRREGDPDEFQGGHAIERRLTITRSSGAACGPANEHPWSG